MSTLPRMERSFKPCSLRIRFASAELRRSSANSKPAVVSDLASLLQDALGLGPLLPRQGHGPPAHEHVRFPVLEYASEGTRMREDFCRGKDADRRGDASGGVAYRDPDADLADIKRERAH